MAVTTGGTPYVESSDLLANYPGASLALANRVDQVMQAPTQNAQTGTAYTAVLLDAGKTVTRSNAAASTHTIPAQATLAWAANTRLDILNIGAGAVTITPAAGVTINGLPRNLTTSNMGSLVRVGTNLWTWVPFAGGGYSYTFTPVITGAGWTFKGHTAFSKVTRIGNLVHYLGYILWDGTGSETVGSSITISIPITATNGPSAFTLLSQQGLFVMPDTSTNITVLGYTRLNTTTAMFPQMAMVTGSPPNTISNGINSSYVSVGGSLPTDTNDRWFWSVIYEAA